MAVAGVFLNLKLKFVIPCRYGHHIQQLGSYYFSSKTIYSLNEADTFPTPIRLIEIPLEVRRNQNGYVFRKINTRILY